jgi:hypothetical protein
MLLYSSSLQWPTTVLAFVLSSVICTAFLSTCNSHNWHSSAATVESVQVHLLVQAQLLTIAVLVLFCSCVVSALQQH